VREETEKATEAQVDDAMKLLEQKDDFMSYGGSSMEPFPPLPIRKPIAIFPV
jgi:hypothetical protein